MFKLMCAGLLLAAIVCCSSPLQAKGGVSIGFGFTFPIGPAYCPRPCYVRPYPVYVPAPVYVRPVHIVQPVQIVEPVEVVEPVQAVRPVQATPVSRTVPVQKPIASSRDGDVDRYLSLTRHQDERERAEAVVQLGRLQAVQAIGTLTVLLREDSPLVRDASARALGLIGASEALPALQHAAQADSDRDVRRSAAFAADVIRANLRR